jgi:hypothetical protein
MPWRWISLPMVSIPLSLKVGLAGLDRAWVRCDLPYTPSSGTPRTSEFHFVYLCGKLGAQCCHKPHALDMLRLQVPDPQLLCGFRIVGRDAESYKLGFPRGVR